MMLLFVLIHVSVYHDYQQVFEVFEVKLRIEHLLSCVAVGLVSLASCGCYCYYYHHRRNFLVQQQPQHVLRLVTWTVLVGQTYRQDCDDDNRN